jgi:phytoene desaturase
MAERRVAVVGAGLAGLSCAARLARAGYRVDLYEQQDQVGGKAGTVSLAGFRFDTGPCLATMPHVFAQLFEEVGESIEHSLRFIPLAPICRYFFPDGTRLAASSDVRAFGEEIEATTIDSREHLERYLAYSRRLYELTADLFLWHSLHEASSYLRLPALRSLFGLRRIDALRSMDAAHRSFFRDPRLVQLFNRYATYNGSSPYRAPATLNLIPYVEYALGGYAVAGGIYAIPAALEALARRQGAEIHLGARVQRILVRNRRVAGIRVAGEDLLYDVVVSNTDVSRTYAELLEDPEAPLAQRYRRLEPSSSALVYFWGIGRAYPELWVNNIFFSADYPAEFRALFDQRRCPADPTVYVNITSKVIPEDAPPGGENWLVLVSAPCNTGQDWQVIAAATRQRVLRRLGRALASDVESEIQVEWIMTPADIEHDTGSRMGSLYGISANTPMAAFLRHRNRCRRPRGLYLCGGSVHPGGGMPLAVLSGKIAADLIRRHEPLRQSPDHGAGASSR